MQVLCNWLSVRHCPYYCYASVESTERLTDPIPGGVALPTLSTTMGHCFPEHVPGLQDLNQGCPCVKSLPIHAGNPYATSLDRVSTAYQLVVHRFASRPFQTFKLAFRFLKWPVRIPQCLCANSDGVAFSCAGLSVPLDYLVLFAASKVVVPAHFIGPGILTCRLTA